MLRKPAQKAADDGITLLMNQAPDAMTWDVADAAAPAEGFTLVFGGGLKTDNMRVGRFVGVPGPKLRRHTIWSRLYSWGLFLGAGFLWLLKHRRAKVLIVYSNPPLLPLVALAARWLWGVRYSVIVYDIYPEALATVAGLNQANWLVRLWQMANKVAYARAQMIVTLTSGMADMLNRTCNPSGKQRVRIAIVPVWVDLVRLQPMSKAQNWFAVEHGQVEKLTVMYSGNTGRAHDIRPVLDAAIALRDHRSIHFMIIGMGEGWEVARRVSTERALENITVLPWQPTEVFPYSLASSDVSIVSTRPGTEWVMFPSKTASAMAIGAAIIAITGAQSPIRSLIEQYDCGVWVDCGDFEGLVAALLHYRQNRALLDRHKAASRRAAEEEFSKQRNLARLMALIH